MKTTFDPTKRDRVLAERGLDLADAEQLFADFHITSADPRHSEAEERFASIGLIRNTVVLVIWTERDDARRIITMWKANERKREQDWQARGRSG